MPSSIVRVRVFLAAPPIYMRFACFCACSVCEMCACVCACVVCGTMKSVDVFLLMLFSRVRLAPDRAMRARFGSSTVRLAPAVRYSISRHIRKLGWAS